MGSKTFLFLGILLAIFFMISYEVVASELAETSNSVKPDNENEVHFDGHGGYNGVSSDGPIDSGYGHGGGGHKRKRCRHGCCKKYYYICIRCCFYAGEASGGSTLRSICGHRSPKTVNASSKLRVEVENRPIDGQRH
ncbi:glycine-rich protein-like [Lycium ferocissimum]|uniref:glycine-rich protein-like n=1 Tax=Lycium ferocissimum TaxID=112874 RepID=UPI002815BE01|nr:glycine-rich protein-like [Lycium ferocissimum]